MSVLRIIGELREHPQQYFECVDIVHLGGFFSGYQAADPGLAAILGPLATRVDGPSGANLFTRAYLAWDSKQAFATVLDLIEHAVRQSVAVNGVTAFADGSFVPSIVRCIQEGRPGMMLGEATVMWLAAYWRGFVVGLEEIGHPVAQSERANLRAFAGGFVPVTTSHTRSGSRSFGYMKHPGNAG